MIYAWHQFVGMTKHDKAWHENDLADELAEYYAETNPLKKWSELSDVVYTCTRGRWSGHHIPFPMARWQFGLGLLYMFPKYTGRWLFFRRAGKKAGAPAAIHEVRNPKKTYKLHIIAERNGIDPLRFQTICEKQLRHWPLLP